MANKHRGEEELRLAGRVYVLRPTMEALAEIEAELGEPLLLTAGRVIAGSIGTKDALAVLRAAIRAGGAEPPESLSEEIMRFGFLQACAVVARWFPLAVAGDPPEESRAPNPPAAESA